MELVAADVVAAHDVNRKKLPVPAYGSYAGMKSQITRMRENGVPPILDRSFFGSISGSLVAQIRGQLRFLGLIDAEFKPTSTLRAIEGTDDAQAKEMLKRAAEQAYATQVALAQQNGTHGQLVDSFKKAGLTGETINRAIAFYLALTEDLGLPKSPHFKKASSSASKPSTPRRPRQPRPKPNPNLLAAGGTGSATIIAPAPAGTSADAQKASYVAMLIELAQKSDDPDAQRDMLDRIERALGLAAPGGRNPDSGG